MAFKMALSSEEEFVKMFPEFPNEYELAVKWYEVLEHAKDWVKQRKWLSDNKVNFKNFPDEIRYLKN